ncbi:hypothetical protein AVEN_36893-1 [Araneus ventricosus]|uniref:MADF domain-containing protein n=1 Tax=Araneus ventricosus TaxID=182803 RepID=A0A4Y2VG71_ARAVE|nr:hypothetical protein AVEN_36893-1 [Araneus ventricosus]
MTTNCYGTLNIRIIIPKIKKNEAWASISSALGREEKGVRQKMTSLLGSFRSQRSKGKKSIGTGKGINLKFFQSIVDFTDVELQQSDVVPTEEECLADEVLHLDTMMPELSNVPASTPAETPRASSIKRKRQQEDPRIEEAFRILKKANKNMEDSSKEDMLDSYGRYIVAKMKKYSAQTQLVVEHEINKILYQADMGCYNGPTEIIPSQSEMH